MQNLQKGHHTSDTLLGGRVQLYQPGEGFRVAIDPVFLAAAVRARPKGRILDVGCGSGAALFCALAREEETSGIGLDIQACMVSLAVKGIKENKLEQRAKVLEGDVALWSKKNEELFDVVLTNPPYFAIGSVPPSPHRNHSHTESEVNLADWIIACLECLRLKGQFVIIHRAERVSDIIAALHRRAGAINIYPLWPKKGQPAKRVVITALKGRRSPTVVHPGLVLHKENGDYTEAANAILKDAASL